MKILLGCAKLLIGYGIFAAGGALVVLFKLIPIHSGVLVPLLIFSPFAYLIGSEIYEKFLDKSE